MTGLVWFDDALVPAAEAAVPVSDHAFTVGDAVFETMKAVDGTPFALTRHLRRLARSAEGLGLQIPDEQQVRAALAAVLDQPGVPELARVRVTYGGGVAPMGSGRGDAPPRLVVSVAPGSAWGEVTQVVTVPWVRNERSAVAGLKTTSYAENVVAVERAHAAGASEAVLANTRGELCEGTGSNVFVVVDGTVLTPPLASGCLAGVTRELVMEWWDVEERVLPYDALRTADEVFLTSSTRDVHPVSAVDGADRSAPGPHTRRVAAEFARRSSEEVDP